MDKLDYLISCLLAERNDLKKIPIPSHSEDKFRLYRTLVNIRPAVPASLGYLEAEDEYLTLLSHKRGITHISSLSPIDSGLYLWKGDITSLKCGAIVNAANSGMTGCWTPCHNCIDNCIHTFAGIRMRLKCHEIMQEQGHDEPTGQAKITPAYNLPASFVIHTVGPIVQGPLTEKHCHDLESSYRSCLDMACQNNIESVALCCISTGVFGFPKLKAARIAVRAARDFLESHDLKIIFNVFSNEDYEIYEQLLKRY